MTCPSVLAVSVSLKLKLVRIKPCPPIVGDAAFVAKVTAIVEDAGFDVIDETQAAHKVVLTWA